MQLKLMWMEKVKHSQPAARSLVLWLRLTKQHRPGPAHSASCRPQHHTADCILLSYAAQLNILMDSNIHSSTFDTSQR